MKLTKLYVMRHAKSDWSSATSDFDRPINQRGEQAANKMAFWLARQKTIPEIIISSPASRARQTIQIVSALIGKKPDEIIWDERIYEAALDNLLKVLRENAATASSLMLVGHNPGLDNLVKHLSCEMPAYSKNGKLMTTAAIAVIDFQDGFNTVAGCGTVLEIARPKEI